MEELMCGDYATGRRCKEWKHRSGRLLIKEFASRRYPQGQALCRKHLVEKTDKEGGTKLSSGGTRV